jgi:hypothetical protein
MMIAAWTVLPYSVANRRILVRTFTRGRATETARLVAPEGIVTQAGRDEIFVPPGAANKSTVTPPGGAARSIWTEALTVVPEVADEAIASAVTLVNGVSRKDFSSPAHGEPRATICPRSLIASA